MFVVISKTVRTLITAVAIIAAATVSLTGCTADTELVTSPTPTATIMTTATPDPTYSPESDDVAKLVERDPAEQQKLIDYLGSSERADRLNAAINESGPRVAQALENGLFGDTYKYQWDKTLNITPDYVGWGGISTTSVQGAEGSNVYAHVYWDHGKIDYSKGVPSFILQPANMDGVMFWGAGALGDFITTEVVSSTTGVTSIVDEKGYGMTSNATYHWVYDSATAAVLDNSAIEILAINIAFIYGE